MSSEDREMFSQWNPDSIVFCPEACAATEPLSFPPARISIVSDADWQKN